MSIANAIKKASRATGADFSYLMKTAARESSFDKSAKAKTSSAAGLFQFIEGTWLQMVKEVGNKFGLDKYTPHIFTTRSGKYYVPNQKLRGEILKLRHNPEVSAMMAGEFTKQNSQFMQERLGRKPSQGELYVAHFLGAKGAADLVSLANTEPNARADRHFPKAARANKAIFYSRGRPRSVAQVYKTLVRDHAKLKATAVAGPAGTPSHSPSMPKPLKSDDAPAAKPATSGGAGSTGSVASPAPVRQPAPIQKAALKQEAGPRVVELESIGPGVEAKVIEPPPAKPVGLLGQKGSPIAPHAKIAALPHAKPKLAPDKMDARNELQGIGTWTTIVNPPASPPAAPPVSRAPVPIQAGEPEPRSAERKKTTRAPRLLEQNANRNETASRTVRTASASRSHVDFTFWERISLYGN
ncbi:MAG: transglycosylase SLT domain-containing protein [Hyphomicrobiaceae bacterium]|nr:transglycosylase SLT domain-containing protein [Hyphomicrobiaceae bacterium]